ncbi:hypothetical protein PAPHI01_1226 [Pancytospora philotis]|nr:hypothetical protein PAPHI01_1226 [Pancytospora philotis]
MDTDAFALLDRCRAAHGYTAKNFRQYKRFCNKKRRGASSAARDEACIYRLESNLAKFQLFNAPRYLHKNLRLLRNASAGYAETYRRYVTCFLDRYHRRLSVEALVELRHALADYHAFLEDVYVLADDQHDFDQYKVAHAWHDVELLFETPRMRDAFVDGTLNLSDHRFNTQLAMRIIKYQHAQKAFEAYLGSDDAQMSGAFERFAGMQAALGDLFHFLENNYCLSEHVRRLHDDAAAFREVLRGLVDDQSGDAGAAALSLPAAYKAYASRISELRSTGKLDRGTLKKRLLKTLERRLGLAGAQPVMPFLPVFYDIAYDYIAYPEDYEDVTASLANTSLCEGTD